MLQDTRCSECGHRKPLSGPATPQKPPSCIDFSAQDSGDFHVRHGAKCHPQQGRTRLWPGRSFPERLDTCWGVQPFLWAGMQGWYKRYCLTANPSRVGYVPYQTALHFRSKVRVRGAYRMTYPRKGTLIVILGAVPGPRKCRCHIMKQRGWSVPKGYCGWVSSACSGCVADLLNKKRWAK